MLTTNRTVRNGFSLIEIMIAIAIIAVLGVTLIPGLLSYLERAKNSRAKTDLHTIQQGIDIYYGDTGQYPTTLRDLVKRPDDPKIKNWQEGYIKGKDVPKDPWGKKYVYEVTPGKEHPYELYSRGKNAKNAPRNEWIDVWNE